MCGCALRALTHLCSCCGSEGVFSPFYFLAPWRQRLVFARVKTHDIKGRIGAKPPSCGHFGRVFLAGGEIKLNGSWAAVMSPEKKKKEKKKEQKWDFLQLRAQAAHPRISFPRWTNNFVAWIRLQLFLSFETSWAPLPSQGPLQSQGRQWGSGEAADLSMGLHPSKSTCMQWLYWTSSCEGTAAKKRKKNRKKWTGISK